jgi:hypothetical protein
MSGDSDVQVKFGAQIEGLVAGVNQVKEQIEGLTSPMSGAMSAFKGLGEAAVAGLALDKVAEAMNKYADLGEQISRTAAITGMSINDVQEFQFAVRMSGGDADTAAMALQRFGRNMAQAASGTGQAAEAYANMHIKVTDLNGKIRPLMDVMGDVADVFAKTADGATKLEYAMALGSRSFGQMIPYLDQGREGLQKLNALFDQTGAKMSPEMVEKGKELAESTRTLGAAWQGLANTIADDVQPAYKGLIDLTTQLMEGTRNLLSGGHDRTAQLMPGAYAEGFKGLGSQQYGPQMPAKAELKPLSGSAGGQGDNGDAEALQIERDYINTELSLSKIALQGKKDLLDQEVAAHQITEVQKYSQLIGFNDQEQAAEEAALADELRLYSEGSAEYERVRDKMEIVDAQFAANWMKLQAQMQQAADKANKQTEEMYKSVFDTIDRDMDTMISGVLQGTQTWQQAMARVFTNLELSFAEAVANMALKWAAFEASSQIFGAGDALTKALGSTVPSAMGGTAQNTALSAAMTKLGAVLGLNTAAHTAGTGATIANTATTATDTIATATGTVSTTGLTVATAAGTVASTANATSNLAGLGLNTLDTGANTAAMLANTAAVTANSVGHLIPLATGAWNIPSIMPALLHPGEMVLDANVASAIRAGASGSGLRSFSGGSIGSSGGSNFASQGPGGGGDTYQVSISLQAIDTQTGAQFLLNNMGVIASGIATQIRNGNSSLTNAMKS